MAPAFRTTSRAGERLAALATCALGFIGFMPYPAINVGNTSAVQLGNILTALMLIPLGGTIGIWRRPLNVFPILAIPVGISTLFVAATGSGDEMSLGVKFAVACGVSLLTLLATQLYAPRFALDLLTGIAVATVVHVLIGLWQFHSFRSDSFPLVELYVNQSFLSVQDHVNTIARYIQRPFGLFPEPSAMSSSLAPWVLLFASHFLGLVHLKQRPTRRQELLFAAAAIGGLLLIILSRSGHAVITLAGLGALVAVWALRIKAKPQTHLLAITGAAVALPFVVTLAVKMLGDRLGGAARMGNSSWQDRTDSLFIGFNLLVDGGPLTALFGVGPGFSSPALQKLAGFEAVWSVLLSYIYETGLIGAIVIACIGWMLLRTWRASQYSLAFATITFVWLIGITITTSYSQLLPIWIALGWLTIWPRVCDTKAAAIIDHIVTAHTAGAPAPAAEGEGRPARTAVRPARRTRGKIQDSAAANA